MCAITFQPQNDVTYTLNSTHALRFNVDPIGTLCGNYDYSVCYSDPLGYYSMNPGAANPWPAMPTFPNDTVSIEVDETCTDRGGTCVPQDIPGEYCGSTMTFLGITICTSTIIGAPPVWPLAHTSAQYSCNLPTDETTEFQGWDSPDALPTIGMWEQTITDTSGDNFSGYTVQEQDAGGGVDTCWWPGSQYLPTTALPTPNTPWTVNANNTWGADYVGRGPAKVAYYRAQGRAPCGFTAHQQMTMYCSDDSWHNYGSVNTLEGSLTNSTVSSVRAGVTYTRRY